MNLLRKIDDDSAKEFPIDGLKKAKKFIDDHFEFEFGVSYEYSTINPINQVENTIKIIPYGKTNRNTEPNQQS
jgi:hypothetical protein